MLRGTVTDAASGEPSACTVTITAPDGAVVRESEAYRGGFRCGGAFEKVHAPGPVRLLVSRGFETRAATRDLVLRPGETTMVSVALERVVDLRHA